MPAGCLHSNNTMYDDLFSNTSIQPITKTVLIHFDGGTPCNIPRLGYGIGYGSYNFDGGEPVRVSHGIPCSNNAAEILTLCCALEALAAKGQCSGIRVNVVGDSQIALKWLNIAAGKRTLKKKKSYTPTGSPDFIASIQRLNIAVKPFADVSGTWLQRDHAVAAFGH